MLFHLLPPVLYPGVRGACLPQERGHAARRPLSGRSGCEWKERPGLLPPTQAMKQHQAGYDCKRQRWLTGSGRG